MIKHLLIIAGIVVLGLLMRFMQINEMGFLARFLVLIGMVFLIVVLAIGWFGIKGRNKRN